MEAVRASRETAQKLIGVMLLTDGYANREGKRPKISYWSNDRELLTLFEQLMQKGYSEKASHVGKSEIDYYKPHVVENVCSDMYRYFGALNKKSLKLDLSSLNDKDIRKSALRLAMSAEGCISVTRKENGAIRGLMTLACANPVVSKQWKELFAAEGIDLNLRKDSAVYSGVQGIQTVRQESIRGFAGLGGFIKGIKIQKGKRYRGFEKNHLLAAYLDFTSEYGKPKSSGYTLWNDRDFWCKFDKSLCRAKMQG